MTQQQAQYVVKHEDMMPWYQVEEARRVLGLEDEAAAELARAEALLAAADNKK